MDKITEIFASKIFDDQKMKAALSSDVYASLKKTIDEDEDLNLEVANEVANAMKEWALANGATHYTHWFQPMTGVTAEKHESFITPSKDGGLIMDFSGKELIKGEPDASSFPSGGLRATFEARGYTAWDPTSYAFIKDNSLCIPTAFCSYAGEALDKKTPLLRSMEALNKQALRIVKLFGDDNTKYIRPSVGPEQEYFLIDKEMFDKRLDLLFTGRTLFGARPIKGQELDDHYYGAIKPRVVAFMNNLNMELWKLGIFAKTEHNEAAPSQHELATIYTTVNIAADHNQIIMETMKKVALRHHLVCLLAEKPFEYVNGSGKHNNWSLTTDSGQNLLSFGNSPYENAQFLLFLCAVIKAVDDYQDLLRIAVASAGNDRRLGASEAPPAIVSIFLGDEITTILEAIEFDKPYNNTNEQVMKLGVSALPKFTKDTTDRNRTSPFAFTGNKFEFRMLGSSESISCTNIMLNSAVAKSLQIFADVLEKADNFEKTLHELIQKTIKEHKRIIFNGNGYDEKWLKEAEKRGLCNYPTTPDCLSHFLDKKNVDMFASLNIYTLTELKSRRDIILENYVKTILIEANTMISMTQKEILPAIESYIKDLAETLKLQKDLSLDISNKYETDLIQKLTSLVDHIQEELNKLIKAEKQINKDQDVMDKANDIKDNLIKIMDKLRFYCDEAEVLTAKKYWPFPTYSDLLFGVN